MERHDCNSTFHLWCMNIRVWVSRLTSSKVKIEFLLRGVPDVFSWFGQLQWTLWKVFGCLEWIESSWDGLLESSCSCLEWVLILMILMLQIMDECLDSSYVIYGWCLKWKNGKRTSGLEDSLVRLTLCFNGGWKVNSVF